MGTVVISDTDVDSCRHLHLPRLAYHIIYRLHQLCRPWKRICPRCSQLHHKQSAFICHAPILPIRSAPVSSSNSCHMRSVSAAVCRGTNAIRLLSRRLLQGKINLCFVKLHAAPITLRWPPIRRFFLCPVSSRSYGLVPEISNSRRSVRISEIRMKIIDTAVNNTD